MSDVPQLPLNSGFTIPQLGFGVFLIDPSDTSPAVENALRVGYRHIDTAEMYENELQVGEAIASSGLDRSEIFLTSKLNNNKIGYDAARVGFEGTLRALGVEYLDLFLIHWPLAMVRDFVETWRAFESIYAEGRARSIGVSNFQITHLERLLNETEVVPAVNQIESHPYLTQEKLLAFHREHGIVTEAWSPLGRGAVLADATVADVASSHGKTPAQVVLRWHIQLGSVVFPKALNQEHMKQNLALFDFQLSEEEMSRLSGLNRDERVGPDPDSLSWIPPEK